MLLLSKNTLFKRSLFKQIKREVVKPRTLENLLDYDRWYDVYKFVCAFIFGREEGEHTKLSEIQFFTLLNRLLSSSTYICIYIYIESS